MTTPGGHQLVGFLTGACLGLFHEGQQYRFNPNVRDVSLGNASSLSCALGEDRIFPAQLEIIATSKQIQWDLSRGT